MKRAKGKVAPVSRSRPPRERRDIYSDALLAQSACNLSGIVHSLSEAMEQIWEEARGLGMGTDYVNTHPVSRLFAEQIMHLAAPREYEDAYRVCRQRAKDPVLRVWIEQITGSNNSWTVMAGDRRVGYVLPGHFGLPRDPLECARLRARLAADAGFPLGATVRTRTGVPKTGTVVNSHPDLAIEWQDEPSESRHATLLAGDEIRNPKRIEEVRQLYEVLA